LQRGLELLEHGLRHLAGARVRSLADRRPHLSPAAYQLAHDPADDRTLHGIWSLIFDLVLAHRGPYMAMLAELGLTPPQATALRALDPERGLPMKELGERLACDASTLEPFDASAAAPTSRNVGGQGARTGGDRRAPAAGGVLGSQWSVAIPALTAAQAFDEALGIESGGWVVVNGAGGVTGGPLVQLAAARGARVIATASAKKAERVRGYGASEVLDYHGDWPVLVREITGGAPKAATLPAGRRPPR
jgi:hypothetical protein